jgi:hypothetical protein
MQNNATTPKNGSPIDSQQINNIPKDKTMTQVVLEKLLDKGEAGINTHEAFDAFGSHCINSYVSLLANKHSLNVNRIKEKHIRQNGRSVSYTRYSIFTPSQVTAAKALLSYFDNKRGVLA